MNEDTKRAAWAEINLNHLRFNIEQIRKKAGPDVDIIGIIKSDAYGHGAVEVGRVLVEKGVHALGVATLQEAMTLRDAGIRCRIITLGLAPSVCADLLLRYDITPVITSFSNAKAISRAALRAGRTAEAFLKVDTGMSRIGLLPTEESLPEIRGIAQLPNLELIGLFSHFATADEADKSYTQTQLSRYERFLQLLKNAGYTFPIRAIGNSAALMEHPASYYNALRPGIVLYGCYPSADVHRENLPLRPVMSVRAGIVQLKRVPAGLGVSYGKRFTTQRESLIATFNIGYADGYPRALSGSGRIIIRGQYAPVIGNICMDYCMADVTDVPGVRQWDEAIFMGEDGDLAITADEIAGKTNTINYEIICGFGQRLPRIYFG